MQYLDKIYKNFINSTGVTTDTRQIKVGNIFFALKGEKFDGNKFAEEAVKKGAILAVVDNCEYKLNDKNYICVENSLIALQELAKLHLKKLNTKVFAITGTNGKTTTKELIKNVLSAKFNVFATEGNFNNHIGLPLTVLKLKKEHDIAVLEMGASKPGDIKELCEIADPQYGLITNIGKAHLEFFGSQENLVKTKSELYDHVCAKNGTIFFNCNNSKYIKIKKYNCKKIEYGLNNKNCKYHATPITVNGIFAGIKINGTQIKSNLVGNYNAENLLAAYTAGSFFGISLEAIKRKIEEYIPQNKRSQFIDNGEVKIILDAYNANPTSMNKSLEAFLNYPGEYEKIAILGDMLELGKESEKEHKNILDKFSKIGCLKIIAVGRHFYKLKNQYKNVSFYPTTEDLITGLKNNKLKNAFVLLKGSRGIKLEDLLPYL